MDAQFSFLLLVWIGRVWPFVIASVALLFAYKKVRNGAAFFVFATLVCFGVQWGVGQFSIALPVEYPADAQLPEQIFHAVRSVAMRTIVLSWVLSIPLVWWLYRLLRVESPER